ncbi:MAG TPA: hypothetical protein VM198_06980 [Longimicrobiales bacterium]|nr:hypothetical protein [Longimicrobiales bacterium]
MSRPMRTALAVAVPLAVAATLATTDLAAQQTASPPTEAELLRRIESLRLGHEEARVAAEAAERRRALDAAARPRLAALIVEVGPLRIVTLPEQAELAADLFGDVWRESFDAVAGSPALAEHVFVFQWAWRRVEPLSVDAAATGGAPVHRVELTRAWARTRGVARARIRDAVWEVLRSDIPDDSPLAGWTTRTGYPSTQRVARLVTMSPLETNRACLAGETSACLAALGLAADAMSVPPETPAMLLLEAIRIGGDGAWARLLEASEAAPLDALAHAAGVDTDALLAAWRTAVLNERPELHAGLGAQAARVLLWMLALAACAMRSTRWRLT